MALAASGKVGRIYTHKEVVYISLQELAPESTPKDGYFRLNRDHPNYNALYSLALVAAVNRYDLQLRTEAEITAQEYADIAYLVVDW